MAMKKFETPWWNDCSYKKGSLGRDMPSIGTLVGLLLALTWRAASALLGLASLPLTSWWGLCRQPDGSPYWLGAHAHVPGDRSWSLQGRMPNSAASSTLRSSKKISPLMIGVQRCAGLFLVVLGRLARGRTKLVNLLPEGSQKHVLSLSAFLCALKEACWHSCRTPVEVGLWNYNVIVRWAYQAKKEEEKQIDIVLFVNEN